MTDDTVNATLVPIAAELVGEPPFGDTRACLGEDTERFFPGREPDEVTWATKAICKGSDTRPPCPVLHTCLLYALRNRVDGIWGGTEPAERVELRRQLKIRARQVSFTNHSRTRRQAS